MKNLILILALTMISMSVAAQTGAGMTYHGRLLKPNGEPVASNVQFRLQILSPGTEQCILWEETQSQDLSSTSGVFVLHLNGSNSTRTDGGTVGFSEVFANRIVITPPAGKCAGSATAFDPTSRPSAPRILRLSFNDGTFSGWEDTTDQAINYAPKAIDALQVAGFPATSLLRFAESSGALVNTSPLNNTQYTELLALLGGTSAQYMKPGDRLAISTSTPTTPVAGSVWLESGELKYHDGTTTQTLSTSASSTQWASGTGAISYTGRVGVGVISPTAKFEVQGSTSDATAAAVNVKNSSGTSALFVRNDGRVGISTVNPSYTLSFGSGAGRTIGVERTTAASTAGNDLTISAGAAAVGGTNLAGGDLYLASGTGTGTSSSNLFFQTASRNTTATADGVLATRMTIDTYGNVGIASSPQSNYKTFISAIRTNPTIGYSGLRVQGDAQQNAGSSTQDLSGIWAHNNPSAGATASLTGIQSGVLAESRVIASGAAGTIANAAGIRALYGITSAVTANPTVTNAYGVLVQPSHEAGTIVNSYGLRIESPTTNGTVTNEYGISQASTTAKNYFAGNVGIGTTSPTDRLTLNSSATYAINMKYADADKLKLTVGSSTQTISAMNQFRFSASNSTTNLSMGGSGQTWIKALGIGGTNFESGPLPSNGLYVEGNVGIGTTTPAYALDVNGALRSANIPFNAAVMDTATYAQDVGGGLAFHGYYQNGSNAVLAGIRGGKENATSGNYDGYIALHTRANGVSSTSERMRITSGGNVGIGTTAATAKLDVVGQIKASGSLLAFGGIDMQHSAIGRVSSITTDGTPGITLNATAGAGNIILQTGGTGNSYERMRINASGNVGIGTTSPSAKLDVQGGNINTSGTVTAGGVTLTSDARFKKNIEPLAGALEKILRLRGVSYDWKRDKYPERHFSSRHQIGVIAQEVERVFPELVETNDITGFKSVNYPAFVSPLIESTKEIYGLCEANERNIVSLTQANEALQQANIELKTRLDQQAEELKLIKKRLGL